MKIAVFGLGYVGLVTAASLSEVGHQVIGYDTDADKLLSLRNSEVPFYEPGLSDLVLENTAQERLEFTDDIGRAIADSDVIFIAVGTPPSEDGSANLESLHQVVDSLGRILERSATIVIKSTVPVGTNQAVQRALNTLLESRGLQLTCDVVSNPEFLREGNALYDVFNPDRIVIGTASPIAFETMQQLYEPFHFHCPFLEIDPASAELSKYAANAFLASRISFMNELSRLAETVGADINHVATALGSDGRIGHHFLCAGIGYGGSCFPKDILSLQHMFRENRIESPLTNAIQQVNSEQRHLFAKTIIERLTDLTDHPTIALWGLTFKPNTDDMRDAPSLDITQLLQKAGANVRLYDPALSVTIKDGFPDDAQLEFVDDMYEAVRGADALVLVTEWDEFCKPDFIQVLQLMRTPNVFDGRNLWDPSLLRSHGFSYYGVGRPDIQLTQKGGR